MTCVGGGTRNGRPAHNIQPSNKAALHAWRDKVAAAALRAVDQGAYFVAQDPVRVELTFTLERPATVDREWPSVPPDVDKLERAILDALTQAALWGDDGQCVGLTAWKAYPGCLLVPHPEDVLDVPGVVIRLTDAPTSRLL